MIVQDSPIGQLCIKDVAHVAATISLCNKNDQTSNPTTTEQKYSKAISAYFSSARSLKNSLPYKGIGTAFQQTVWQAICSIPSGEIRTYKDIAKMIGKPNAARAVGNALNKNPYLLQVPCHRVVPANGSRKKCGGFACGSTAKQWLLRYEQN